MASNGYANGPANGPNGVTRDYTKGQGQLGRGKYLENGREYPDYPRGQYLFPIDEREMDRLDAMNKFFLVARRYNLWSPRISLPKQNCKILDLGCGTHIWALDVARKIWSTNPDSIVHGVDLTLEMQPQSIFPNTKFSAMDIEGPWILGRDPLTQDWNLIYARMLGGSIYSWPRLYRQIFSHLAPGYWFEHVEIDWCARNDQGPVTPNLNKWSQDFLNAMDLAERPVRIDAAHTQQMLANAGFIEINQEAIPIPVNGGSTDPYESDVGRWFNLCFHKAFTALSLAPLCKYGNWSPESLSEFSEAVLREMGDRANRSYCILYIWTARKPALNA